MINVLFFGDVVSVKTVSCNEIKTDIDHITVEDVAELSLTIK